MFATRTDTELQEQLNSFFEQARIMKPSFFKTLDFL